METITSAPAATTVPDTVAAALAAGHVPSSLAVHVAQLGLMKLERPMTIAGAAAAADEDGFLTAAVEVSLYALSEGRAMRRPGRTTRSPVRWFRSASSRRR
ncbi:hypothetical protein RCG67_06655 [Kocuria sp. CPCC 205292]|uniref:hypothetical protein n=1 Tax=Kocuria cellulosilytica TaxID=3071451 RepID=UPI0034D4C77C